ncbi:MAG: serine protease [Piscirickettsiaceae bacterium]|nr:MAG: serine protease [Piscirickettsiaceae bacterium]PCI66896.1 MAG: serine protease [Piscirickettsiaceae bacterium]
MKFYIKLSIICLVMAGIPAWGVAEPSKQAFILEINGVIGPATADYFQRSLAQAHQANAEFVLLTLDTPGGLGLSMREIIKKIIASPVPVITYVTPSGSRAASAGTYILYASHIAAMAPATNLGAATPVQLIPSIGSDKEKPTAEKEQTQQPHDAMGKKVLNDAVAYIRGLAKLRGRNEQWAEKAVRIGASLPAEEALEQNVIDILAIDQADLFRQLDGVTVNVLGKDRTLTTTSLTVKKILPNWRNKLLGVISNPNVAYILMLIGIYGLIFEFANPGAIVPGTVGSICLLLALFAFQALPMNYAGLVLILLGIGLMTAEAFQPSFGVLGLGGVVAFVFGSIILIDTEILPGYGINLGIIAGFTVSSVIFFVLAFGLVFKARRNPIVSGQEEMIGSACVVLDAFERQGRVRVHGEVWNARCQTPMKKGERARVVAINGLTLDITPET